MSEDRRLLFVVTSGMYSSYGIDAIFDDRSLAEAYLAKRHTYDDSAAIEEWPLNPNAENIRQGRATYRVVLRRNGDVVTTESVGFAEIEIPGVTFLDIYGAPKMNVLVAASSLQQAIKAANEIRAQWLATPGNQWPLPIHYPAPPKDDRAPLAPATSDHSDIKTWAYINPERKPQ